MNEINFLIQLREQFPSQLLSTLLFALRQDKELWVEISETSLGERALSELPLTLEAWTPAGLSLYALGHFEFLSRIRETPPQPLESDLKEKAHEAFEKWGSMKLGNINLAEAGLLALAIRDQYFQKESWDGLENIIKNQPSRLGTVLSCLYGFLPEPHEFISCIEKVSRSQDQSTLALQIIFSNPLSAEAQNQLIGKLLAEQSLDNITKILQTISIHRPWQVRPIAEGILERYDQNTENSYIKKNAAVEKNLQPLNDLLEDIADQVRLAQIYDLAKKPEASVSKFAEIIANFRPLRAQLSANLAQAITSTPNSTQGNKKGSAFDTSVDAWKQAIKLIPEEPAYAAGLAKTLTKAGKLEDAQAVLQSKNLKIGQEVQPNILITKAAIANQRKDKNLANQLAHEALAGLSDRIKLSRDDYRCLVEIFENNQLFPEMVQTTRMALKEYPSDLEFLQYHAIACSKTAQPQAALESIYSALSVNELEAEIENAETTNRPILDQLLIENLEAINAWKAALKERERYIAKQAEISADEYLHLAKCALNADEPQRTLEVSEMVLKTEPENDHAHSLLAKAANQLGDIQVAEEHYDRAVQLNPDNAENWIALGEMYRSNGQSTKMVETLRMASQALPNDARIHLALGEAFLKQAMATQALTSFKRAYQLQPDEKIALRLGQTMLSLGHFEDALSVLGNKYEEMHQQLETKLQGKSISEDGISDDGISENKISYDYPELTYGYAQALIGVGDHSQAISILGDLISAQPNNPAPCLDMAKALLQIDDQPDSSQRAVPFLKRILSIENPSQNEAEPKSSFENFLHQDKLREIQAEAKFYLAEALENLGDMKQSMQAYRKALEANQDQDSSRRMKISLGLGRVALKLDQAETAIAALKEVTKTEPLNAAAQRSLSEAYLASNLAPEAFETACAAMELKPSDLPMLTWFIDHGKKIHQLDSARGLQIQEEIIQALRRALKIEPERLDLLASLGEILSENGQKEEALKIYRQIAEMPSEKYDLPTEIIYKMGKSVRKLGDPKLATQILESAVDNAQSEGSREIAPSSQVISKIYAELADAYRQTNELPAARSAIKHAIELDPHQINFLEQQSEIESAEKDYQAAYESLKEALRLDPSNIDLHYQIANLLIVMGYLPTAYAHVEQALAIDENLPESSSTETFEMKLLAAELSYLLLQSERAQAYLTEIEPQKLSKDNLFRHICLQVDLDLDGDHLDAAQKTIAEIRALNPEHPRCRAARAHLKYLQGESASGVDILKNIFKDQGIEKQDNAITYGNKIGIERNEKVLTWLTVNRAAIRLNLWEEAFSVIDSLLHEDPHEPLANLRSAQMLVYQAEALRLSQDLAVMNHIISIDALSDQARDRFQKAIHDTKDNLRRHIPEVEDKEHDWWENEASREITLWETRGQAIFQPGSQNAAQFKSILKALKPKPEDIASLMTAFRNAGENETAINIVKMDWHPSYSNTESSSDPSVLVQLSLSLEQEKPNQAFNIALDALERVQTNNHQRWVSPEMVKYLLARIAMREGNYSEALQYIREAISAWEDEGLWHALAAEIYQINAPDQQLPDLEQATYHLAKSVNLMPDYAPNYIHLGQVYTQQSEFDLAIEALEKASQSAPENGVIWLLLAKAQNGLEDYEAAIFSLDLAIDRLEQPLEAQLLRAELSIKTNNPGDAFNRAHAILDEHPEHPQALFILSQALQALDKPVEALNIIEKILPTVADNTAINLNRMQLIKQSKGISKALEELNQEVSHHPDNPELIALLAEWLLEAGKQELAVKTARTALQYGVNNDKQNLPRNTLADLHYLIGKQTRESGQLDQAIYHLNETIRYAPEKIEPYIELGEVYQARREFKQALKVYQKAIDSTEPDYRPYYYAGKVLKDNKDYLAAEAMLQKAEQLAPNEVGIHRLLGAVVALNFIHNRRRAPTES